MHPRPATPADLAAVVAIERACFGDEAYTHLQLRQWLDLSGPLFVVATVDDVPVGHAIGAVDHAGDGWVLALAVHPDARRHRLGHALTTAVLDALDARGVDVTRLTVTPDNAPARALYGALGFVTEAEVDAYYGPGAARLVLRRTRPR
ncbi:MAG: GNAT family N-acetyltransferase [Alphaproteobacteria bacterium]|nr:GNAT family N-acetyltransferase [Alphaproteobacteria bacterium]